MKRGRLFRNLEYVLRRILRGMKRSCGMRYRLDCWKSVGQWRNSLWRFKPCEELAKYFSNPGRNIGRLLRSSLGYEAIEDDVKLTYRNQEVRIVSSVDSNYATDKEDRRSVSGAYILRRRDNGGCARLSRMCRSLRSLE
jgi:hypothetical protein